MLINTFICSVTFFVVYLFQMKTILNHGEGKRKEQILQGAYDGRFRPRTVKDKKKQQSKNWARKGGGLKFTTFYFLSK